MIRKDTELVLGRGEVYFDPFAAGTRVGSGELYLGNTTTFQLSRSIGRAERMRSVNGLRVEREGVVTEESHSVQFITDNISIENAGLWFGQEDGENEFRANYFITESFVVRRNRFYQLGKTAQYLGTRRVENVSVAIGGMQIPSDGNWDVDHEFGRIQILAKAPDIVDGALVNVTFEWRTILTESARSKPRDLFGALRFIATNPIGTRRNYFFPFVRLSPRGSVDLKGDEWQQLPFDVKVMRLSPSIEQVYIDGTTSVGYTVDEEAIVNDGISLSSFPYWDEQLHKTVNVDLVNAGLDVLTVYP